MAKPIISLSKKIKINKPTLRVGFFFAQDWVLFKISYILNKSVFL